MVVSIDKQQCLSFKTNGNSHISLHGCDKEYSTLNKIIIEST